MLTERQEVILDFVREYQASQGVPPSTREVAQQFQCAQQVANRHLQALARKGQLGKLADGKWGLSAREVQSQLFQIPVYGWIPAGLPGMQEQQPEEFIAIDPAAFGVTSRKPGDLWALRVQGDSMEGAHIIDGDVVALQRRDPRPGEIVAALVDGTTTTLKRLVIAGGRPVLRAENPRYADIAPERLECQGVVVGVIRRVAG
jgi:repressor LexA